MVARVFGKRHDNVLKDIREIDCSAEFRLLNFEESYYKNEQGKRQPCCSMTRDGFVFMAMGWLLQGCREMRCPFFVWHYWRVVSGQNGQLAEW